MNHHSIPLVLLIPKIYFLKYYYQKYCLIFEQNLKIKFVPVSVRWKRKDLKESFCATVILDKKGKGYPHLRNQVLSLNETCIFGLSGEPPVVRSFLF